VLRDNAKNMTKGLEDAGACSVGCLAHTLQLAVNAGLESQRALEDAVAICRKIATHFRHSTLAKERLRDIQQATSDANCHQIVQDVQTRWNSTFYMVQRLLEQKKAVINYATDYDLPAVPTKHQWSLLEKLVDLLEPFEELTRQLSSDDATLADVIPVVTALQLTLERHENDTGVQTMKGVLLDELKTRFASMHKQSLLVVATVVDPRYKTKFFTDERLDDARKMVVTAVRSSQSPAAEEDANPPATKRPRTEATTKLSNIMDDILERGVRPASEVEQQRVVEAAVPGTDSAEEQVRLYLAQPNIPRSESPTAWWQANAGLFPQVAEVARRYLSAPATSVPSERLFSAAGLIYTDRRNRLLPERAEMLLFIRHNLTV